MKTLTQVKNEGNKARADLRQVYNHQKEKIKQDFEKKMNEKHNDFKKLLKLEKHYTDLHRKRATNFKTEAEELKVKLKG